MAEAKGEIEALYDKILALVKEWREIPAADQRFEITEAIKKLAEHLRISNELKDEIVALLVRLGVLSASKAEKFTVAAKQISRVELLPLKQAIEPSKQNAVIDSIFDLISKLRTVTKASIIVWFGNIGLSKAQIDKVVDLLEHHGLLVKEKDEYSMIQSPINRVDLQPLTDIIDQGEREHILGKLLDLIHDLGTISALSITKKLRDIGLSDAQIDKTLKFLQFQGVLVKNQEEYSITASQISDVDLLPVKQGFILDKIIGLAAKSISQQNLDQLPNYPRDLVAKYRSIERTSFVEELGKMDLSDAQIDESLNQMALQGVITASRTEITFTRKIDRSHLEPLRHSLLIDEIIDAVSEFRASTTKIARSWLIERLRKVGLTSSQVDEALQLLESRDVTIDQQDGDLQPIDRAFLEPLRFSFILDKLLDLVEEWQATDGTIKKAEASRVLGRVGLPLAIRDSVLQLLEDIHVFSSERDVYVINRKIKVNRLHLEPIRRVIVNSMELGTKKEEENRYLRSILSSLDTWRRWGRIEKSHLGSHIVSLPLQIRIQLIEFLYQASLLHREEKGMLRFDDRAIVDKRLLSRALIPDRSRENMFDAGKYLAVVKTLFMEWHERSLQLDELIKDCWNHQINTIASIATTFVLIGSGLFTRKDAHIFHLFFEPWDGSRLRSIAESVLVDMVLAGYGTYRILDLDEFSETARPVIDDVWKERFMNRVPVSVEAIYDKYASEIHPETNISKDVLVKAQDLIKGAAGLSFLPQLDVDKTLKILIFTHLVKRYDPVLLALPLVAISLTDFTRCVGIRHGERAFLEYLIPVDLIATTFILTSPRFTDTPYAVAFKEFKEHIATWATIPDILVDRIAAHLQKGNLAVIEKTSFRNPLAPVDEAIFRDIVMSVANEWMRGASSIETTIDGLHAGLEKAGIKNAVQQELAIKILEYAGIVQKMMGAFVTIRQLPFTANIFNVTSQFVADQPPLDPIADTVAYLLQDMKDERKDHFMTRLGRFHVRDSAAKVIESLVKYTIIEESVHDGEVRLSVRNAVLPRYLHVLFDIERIQEDLPPWDENLPQDAQVSDDDSILVGALAHAISRSPALIPEQDIAMILTEHGLLDPRLLDDIVYAIFNSKVLVTNTENERLRATCLLLSRIIKNARSDIDSMIAGEIDEIMDDDDREDVGDENDDDMSDDVDELDKQAINSTDIARIYGVDIKELIREKKWLINGALLPFQLQGSAFLSEHKCAILADEMGLGKTHQAIEFLLQENALMERPLRQALVIVPSSMVEQWREKIEKYAPPLTVEVIEGARKRREKLWNSIAIIHLVNFEKVTPDYLRHLIDPTRYSHVIVDEAGRIKNPTADRTRAIKAISANAVSRIAITGTPLENNLTDVWSILSFIKPDILGSLHHFKKRFSVLETVTPRVDLEKRDDLGNYLKILREFRAFMVHASIRRRKADVLTYLPPIKYTEVRVRLDPTVQQSHDAMMDGLEYLLLPYTADSNHLRRLKAEARKPWRKKGQSKKYSIFSQMSAARQLCVVPERFIDKPVKNAKLDAIASVVASIPFPYKVVIFTEYLRAAKSIIATLSNYRPLLVTGDVLTKHRKAIINQFNNEPMRRILVATSVFEFGVDLQSANYVINYDMHYNLARMNQRIDRVHRLGQTNEVTVINIIAEDTIEERYFNIHCKKHWKTCMLIEGEWVEPRFSKKAFLQDLADEFIKYERAQVPTSKGQVTGGNSTESANEIDNKGARNKQSVGEYCREKSKEGDDIVYLLVTKPVPEIRDIARRYPGKMGTFIMQVADDIENGKVDVEKSR